MPYLERLLLSLFFFFFLSNGASSATNTQLDLTKWEPARQMSRVFLFSLTLLLPICIHIWDGTSRLLQGSRLFTDSLGNIRNMCWLPVVVVVERKGHIKGALLCLCPTPPKILLACLFWIFNNSFKVKFRRSYLQKFFLKVTKTISQGHGTRTLMRSLKILSYKCKCNLQMQIPLSHLLKPPSFPL